MGRTSSCVQQYLSRPRLHLAIYAADGNVGSGSSSGYPSVVGHEGPRGIIKEESRKREREAAILAVSRLGRVSKPRRRRKRRKSGGSGRTRLGRYKFGENDEDETGAAGLKSSQPGLLI